MKRTTRLRAGLLGTAWSLAALAAPAGEAHAQGANAQGLVFQLPLVGTTSFTFTNTTIATLRSSNFDDNFYDENLLGFTERFDSALSAPPWRLQLRFDGFVPLPGGPDFAFYRSGWPTQQACTMSGAQCVNTLRWDFRLERVQLRYQRGILTFELGDFYTVVGRGVSLSLRKVDPLGLDTTIRGARFDLDLGRVTLRPFGGYANPQNLDPVTLATYHDWGGPLAQGDAVVRPAPDILGGLDALVRLGPDEDVELGFNAMRVYFPESNLLERFVDVIGYRVTAPALADGALSLHGEVHALRRIENLYNGSGPRNMDRGSLRNSSTAFGRAIYASAQVTMPNWSGLLEFKDYDNFLVSPDGGGVDARRIYSSAPSLEREDVQFRTNSNVRGGRAQFQYSFRPGPWSLAVNFAGNGFTEQSGVDPWDGTGFFALHGYLTLRRRGQPPRRTGPPTPGSGDSNSAGAGGGGSGVQSATTGGLSNTTRVAAGDWQLTANLGFRQESTSGVRGSGMHVRNTGAADWQIAHADVDVVFSLNNNHSLEFRLDGRVERRWSDQLVHPDLDPQCGINIPVDQQGTDCFYYTFFRGGLAGTWSFQDRLAVSASMRVDTTGLSLGRTSPIPQLGGYDPTMPLRTATMPDNMGNAVPATRDYPFLYPAGEVRWMFSPGNSLRLFGGMTPGGRVCTGGVCRDVPPFQGAYLELVLRL